ncbi:hypothetical protein LCGC14_0174990 [marine sediment metagenome]|uniref:Uncharacterized protein n=1 Tax=marine sediment metagenome TaxID=412755 RepID=A0A0F9UR59_9ZZZZ
MILFFQKKNTPDWDEFDGPPTDYNKIHCTQKEVNVITSCEKYFESLPADPDDGYYKCESCGNYICSRCFPEACEICKYGEVDHSPLFSQEQILDIYLNKDQREMMDRMKRKDISKQELDELK